MLGHREMMEQVQVDSGILESEMGGSQKPDSGLIVLASFVLCLWGSPCLFF